MIDDNAKLLERIRTEVLKDPTFIRKIMKAIDGGLDDLAEREKRKRIALARNAVQMLMANQTDDVMFLIDAAYHQFPCGPDRHAEGEKLWWSKFLDVASNQPMDEEWLINAKGGECRSWWRSVVAPAIAERRAQPVDMKGPDA